MYSISKDVPVPKHDGRGGRKYPFADMDVGDSFLVKNDDPGKNKVRGAAYAWGRRYGLKFRTIKEDGGVRVFRIS